MTDAASSELPLEKAAMPLKTDVTVKNGEGLDDGGIEPCAAPNAATLVPCLASSATYTPGSGQYTRFEDLPFEVIHNIQFFLAPAFVLCGFGHPNGWRLDSNMYGLSRRIELVARRSAVTLALQNTQTHRQCVGDALVRVEHILAPPKEETTIAVCEEAITPVKAKGLTYGQIKQKLALREQARLASFPAKEVPVLEQPGPAAPTWEGEVVASRPIEGASGPTLSQIAQLGSGARRIALNSGSGDASRKCEECHRLTPLWQLSDLELCRRCMKDEEVVEFYTRLNSLDDGDDSPAVAGDLGGFCYLTLLHPGVHHILRNFGLRQLSVNQLLSLPLSWRVEAPWLYIGNLSADLLHVGPLGDFVDGNVIPATWANLSLWSNRNYALVWHWFEDCAVDEAFESDDDEEVEVWDPAFATPLSQASSQVLLPPQDHLPLFLSIRDIPVAGTIRARAEEIYGQTPTLEFPPAGVQPWSAVEGAFAVNPTSMDDSPPMEVPMAWQVAEARQRLRAEALTVVLHHLPLPVELTNMIRRFTLLFEAHDGFFWEAGHAAALRDGSFFEDEDLLVYPPSSPDSILGYCYLAFVPPRLRAQVAEALGPYPEVNQALLQVCTYTPPFALCLVSWDLPSTISEAEAVWSDGVTRQAHCYHVAHAGEFAESSDVAAMVPDRYHGVVRTLQDVADFIMEHQSHSEVEWLAPAGDALTATGIHCVIPQVLGSSRPWWTKTLNEIAASSASRQQGRISAAMEYDVDHVVNDMTTQVTPASSGALASAETATAPSAATLTTGTATAPSAATTMTASDWASSSNEWVFNADDLSEVALGPAPTTAAQLTAATKSSNRFAPLAHVGETAADVPAQYAVRFRSQFGESSRMVPVSFTNTPALKTAVEARRADQPPLIHRLFHCRSCKASWIWGAHRAVLCWAARRKAAAQNSLREFYTLARASSKPVQRQSAGIPVYPTPAAIDLRRQQIAIGPQSWIRRPVFEIRQFVSNRYVQAVRQVPSQPVRDWITASRPKRPSFMDHLRGIKDGLAARLGYFTETGVRLKSTPLGAGSYVPAYHVPPSVPCGPKFYDHKLLVSNHCHLRGFDLVERGHTMLIPFRAQARVSVMARLNAALRLDRLRNWGKPGLTQYQGRMRRAVGLDAVAVPEHWHICDSLPLPIVCLIHPIEFASYALRALYTRWLQAPDSLHLRLIREALHGFSSQWTSRVLRGLGLRPIDWSSPSDNIMQILAWYPSLAGYNNDRVLDLIGLWRPIYGRASWQCQERFDLGAGRSIPMIWGPFCVPTPNSHAPTLNVLQTDGQGRTMPAGAGITDFSKTLSHLNESTPEMINEVIRRLERHVVYPHFAAQKSAFYANLFSKYELRTIPDLDRNWRTHDSCCSFGYRVPAEDCNLVLSCFATRYWLLQRTEGTDALKKMTAGKVRLLCEEMSDALARRWHVVRMVSDGLAPRYVSELVHMRELLRQEPSVLDRVSDSGADSQPAPTPKETVDPTFLWDVRDACYLRLFAPAARAVVYDVLGLRPTCEEVLEQTFLHRVNPDVAVWLNTRTRSLHVDHQASLEYTASHWVKYLGISTVPLQYASYPVATHLVGESLEWLFTQAQVLGGVKVRRFGSKVASFLKRHATTLSLHIKDVLSIPMDRLVSGHRRARLIRALVTHLPLNQAFAIICTLDTQRTRTRVKPAHAPLFKGATPPIWGVARVRFPGHKDPSFKVGGARMMPFEDAVNMHIRHLCNYVDPADVRYTDKLGREHFLGLNPSDVLSRTNLVRRINRNPYVDTYVSPHAYSTSLYADIPRGYDGLKVATPDNVYESMQRYGPRDETPNLTRDERREIAEALFWQNPELYAHAELSQKYVKNLHASAGFPLLHMGTKQDMKRFLHNGTTRHGKRYSTNLLTTLCRAGLESWRNPEWPIGISHVFPKSQVLKAEKLDVPGNLRTIVGVPLFNQVRGRLVHGDINDRRDPWGAPGKPGMPMTGRAFDRMLTNALAHKFHHCLDGTKYDSTVKKQILDVSVELRKMGFAWHPDRELIFDALDVVRDTVFNSWLVNVVAEQDSDLRSMYKYGGIATGHESVTEDNTETLQVVVIATLSRLWNMPPSAVMANIMLENVGDDNFLHESIGIDKAEFSRIAKDLTGVEFRFESSGESVEGQEFLRKTGFLLTEDERMELLNAGVEDVDGLKFRITHDRTTLLMRYANLRIDGHTAFTMTNVNKFLRYEFLLERQVGYVQLCAHYKDVYDFIVADRERLLALGVERRDITVAQATKLRTSKRLRLPSYSMILQKWYAPLPSDESRKGLTSYLQASYDYVNVSAYEIDRSLRRYRRALMSLDPEFWDVPDPMPSDLPVALTGVWRSEFEVEEFVFWREVERGYVDSNGKVDMTRALTCPAESTMTELLRQSPFFGQTDCHAFYLARVPALEERMVLWSNQIKALPELSDTERMSLKYDLVIDEVLRCRFRMTLLSIIYSVLATGVSSLPAGLLSIGPLVLDLVLQGQRRFYSWLSYSHWLDQGCGSHEISNLSPKDAYGFYKFLAIKLLARVPRRWCLPRAVSMLPQHLGLPDWGLMLNHTAWAVNSVLGTFSRRASNGISLTPTAESGIMQSEWEAITPTVLSKVLCTRNRALILDAPTGTGKTYFFPQYTRSDQIALMNGGIRIVNHLVLVPTRILAEQTSWPASTGWYRCKRGTPFTGGLCIMTYGHARAIWDQIERICGQGDTLLQLDEYHFQQPELLWVNARAKSFGYIRILSTATPSLSVDTEVYERYIAPIKRRYDITDVNVGDTSPQYAFHSLMLCHQFGDSSNTLVSQYAGRVLVIVPTIALCERVCSAIRDRSQVYKDAGHTDFKIGFLHAGQRNVPSEGHIVATEMVNAGITIKGITAVIHCGVETVSHYGFVQRIQVSDSTRIQARGRTGRTNDGLFISCGPSQPDGGAIMPSVTDVIYTDILRDAYGATHDFVDPPAGLVRDYDKIMQFLYVRAGALTPSQLADAEVYWRCRLMFTQDPKSDEREATALYEKARNGILEDEYAFLTRDRVPRTDANTFISMMTAGGFFWSTINGLQVGVPGLHTTHVSLVPTAPGVSAPNHPCLVELRNHWTPRMVEAMLHHYCIGGASRSHQKQQIIFMENLPFGTCSDRELRSFFS